MTLIISKCCGVKPKGKVRLIYPNFTDDDGISLGKKEIIIGICSKCVKNSMFIENKQGERNDN